MHLIVSLSYGFDRASPPALFELWRAAYAKTSPFKPLLACQPKPWRRLVEARGVEPLSGTPFTKTSTRLACDQWFGILRLACSVVTLETC